MKDLPKQYDPHAHEVDIYREWENAGIFKPDKQALDAGRKPFVIMLPPPNITGSLHMGHALQDTIMDILSRWNRMQGNPTLWLPGTDHAAIATNRVLEKQLQEEGIERREISREQFLERAQSWYDKTGSIIINQMKRLGCSCDWTRSRFTMDKKYVQAVNEAFIRYHKKGYIYRGNRIVNWCISCESVISDLETKYEQQDTKLVTIKYPFDDGTGGIEVATTRPETMLGDTAVAVHPDDARYKKVIGKKVVLPITGRLIPVIADERIDSGFGTGAVKVTPAHDPLDAEIGITHGLPVLNIISEQGYITNTDTSLDGLSTHDARQKILASLKEEHAIVKEEDHSHNASLCDRCGAIVEPLISRQWFVDMDKLKDETIDVAGKEKVSFKPERWKKHFLDWMDNVHDWTISRQIWLGHQIPVWWKPGARGSAKEQESDAYIVALDKPQGNWERDPDVLDTWFSSALWPFAALGWPDNSEDLTKFYPTSTLVTGRDILYLWVARMVFSGLDLMDGKEFGDRDQDQRIPFRDVFIHPTVMTKTGQRMSKSLGTGVDPLDLIEKYGADATRFGLMYQMNYDRQAVKFDERIIKNSRNFGNKIWNLSRFILSLSKDSGPETVADKWIRQRADNIVLETDNLLKDYKIGEAARVLYDFIWKDFADWYVEILKVEGSAAVARDVFKVILKLLHPFMPHITEVIWPRFSSNGKMIAVESWPKAAAQKSGDEEINSAMNYFKDLVGTVRSARQLLDIPPGTIVYIDPEQRVLLEKPLSVLCRAKIKKISGKKVKFALQDGQVVNIASDKITDDSVEKAKVKLSREEENLVNLLENQNRIVEQMKKNKVIKNKIKEKETLIAGKTKRLQEIRRGLKLFS